MPQRSIKALFFTLSLISLILIAAGSIWLYHYTTKTIAEKLAHSSHEKADTIRYKIIQYYDEMTYTFIHSESKQTAKMVLAQHYFEQNGMNAPLKPLQKLLEDSESEYDIYIINRNMIVERTTFSHDLHLDYKQYRYVPALLNLLFNNPAKLDLSEPIQESYSNDFKRYQSQSSPDSRYIIQLRQTLKKSKSFHLFMKNLQELVPTLHRQATYNVYLKSHQAVTATDIWSKRLSKIKEKNTIKLWGGLGNFQEVIQRLDPVSQGIFRQPNLFLYPYLNTMFIHDSRKEASYWEHGLYIRMVMLPYKSYYNHIEESYGILVLELDETQAYEDAQTLKMTLFVIWSILIAFILSMAFLFYRRIIFPITLLQSQMHRKLPLDDQTILIRGDEVSRISRTYNWLLKDLKNEVNAKQTLLTQFKTFTANAIHQVRTPLSVIKIAHTMLDDQTNKEARLNILSSIVSMEHLYDSLAFTLKNETIELPTSHLNLSAILEERANLFTPVASSLDTQILRTIRADIFMEMNKTELEYLIDNNLSNALKYGQPFKPITITLTHSTNESILLFESYGDPISDTTEIFKRYVRENHSKSGSGIGLHIVAAICNRYQILIQVTYENGKNCFRYFIPAK